MFKIAVCGCGVVGSGVADILMEQSDKLSARYNEQVSLGYILDIKDLSGTPYEKYQTKDIDVILADSDVRLLSVTIGGLGIDYEICRKALASGRHVVTSNKAVVAAYGRELERMAFESGVRFMYEASVGGGIPIIRPLNICLYANDINEIQGILNGTTNYMLTGMYRDKMSFDDILKDAQQKGFAEADPTADVDGYDAARKIAILSSIAYGVYVNYEDVPCTGIRDIIYADHELASAAGYTIKLIAGSRNDNGKVDISVEPKLVPKSHILAAVNSVYNAVFTKGSYTGDSMFYGQGAGKLATASAVVGDIIEILSKAQLPTLPRFVDNTAVIDVCPSGRYRFYVRLSIAGCESAGCGMCNGVDTDSDDIAAAVKGIFGESAYYIGFSMADNGTCAFITDYRSCKDLQAAVAQLEESANVKASCVMKILE